MQSVCISKTSRPVRYVVVKFAQLLLSEIYKPIQQFHHDLLSFETISNGEFLRHEVCTAFPSEIDRSMELSARKKIHRSYFHYEEKSKEILITALKIAPHHNVFQYFSIEF